MAWGPAAFAAVALVWVDQSVAPLALPLDGERALIAAIGAVSVVLGHRRGLDPGRPRARRRLHDRRRRRVRRPRPGRPRPRRLGAGPDLAPRLRRRPERASRPGWSRSTAAFGTRRLPELRGWARRAPLLAVALVVDRRSPRSAGRASSPGRRGRRSLGLALPDRSRSSSRSRRVASLAIYGRILLVGVRPSGRAVRPAAASDPAGRSAGRHADGRARRDRARRSSGAAHALAGLLDVLWALPAAARLNRGALAVDGGPRPRRPGVRAPAGGVGSRRARAAAAAARPSAIAADAAVRARGRRRRPSTRRSPHRAAASRPAGAAGQPSGSTGARPRRRRRQTAPPADRAASRRATPPGRAPSGRCRARSRAARPARTTGRARPRRSPGCPTRGRGSGPSRARSRRGSCPGAASCGRVAPFIARTTAIAFGPSRASGDERRRRDEVDEAARRTASRDGPRSAARRGRGRRGRA